MLDAKLSVPQPRRGIVPRDAVIERARSSGCRVVGVTAPAGYGKSTLLAEWARADARRVAWVALDRFDDDPTTLLTVLASAYVRLAPGNPDLIAGMAGMGVSVLGRAAPRLAAALRASPAPFLLILDDVHELRSPACHDVLSVVISGIPPGSQLVASSRYEQPYLARLRAAGDAMEVLAGDLALDAGQAVRIFSSARVTLTAEAAAAVTARTEGWPVGLQLAALIARDGGGDPAGITGDDRYVSDYLYREALGRQPEDVQRFLRRTAVLDQVSAPLCDALLDEPGTQGRLRGIETAGLFLVPLDRRREWFRYHALFREFLLAELRRVEPEAIPKLHLRAADWYEANGSPALALEHLLNTSERERCIHLVAELTLPTYQAGRMSTVQRWLAALGDAAMQSYPPLAVLAGYDRGVRRAEHRGGPPGAYRRGRLVRGGAVGWHGVVRLGAGHAAGPDVPRRTASDAAGREPRDGVGAVVESVAGHRADPVRGGAADDRGPGAGRRPVRPVLGPGPVAVEHRLVRGQRVRTGPAGDGSRPVGGGGRARGRRVGRRRGELGAGLLDEPAAVRRRGPIVRAPRRGEGGEPAAQPGDAGPPVVHVRVLLARRPGPPAAGQGVLGARPSRRPLVTCSWRSTTSCTTDRTWGCWWTRSRPSATS